MESYVVRIYRRDQKDGRNLAGQVELTDREQIKSFSRICELVDILLENEPRKTSTKKRRQIQRL